MPKTVPAADAGLPKLNRRSALAKLGLGIAATSTLATASAMAAPQKTAVSPELLRLIEAHQLAYAALDRAIHRESAAEEAYRGLYLKNKASVTRAQDQANRQSSGLLDAEAEEERANAAEMAAAFKLCDYRCVNIDDVKAKASYILTVPPIMQHTANDFFEALLESMA